MNKSSAFRKVLGVAITTVLLLITGLNAPAAFASDGTFDLTVTHAINGKDLGLDKELPVNVFVNGSLTIEGFRFGEVVSTSLPAGNYTIDVQLMDGTPIPSMSVGPVDIPAHVEVDIKARLDAKDTPILQVNAAERTPEVNTFDLKVTHNVDGSELGLPKDLPVNVYVNGALAIPGFEYGENAYATLPEGTYTVTVTLLDGTPISTMIIDSAEIPAGVDVFIKARLDASNTPFLNVNVR